MSRYVIPGYNEAHYCVVGWDSPLSTFFLHVDDKALVEDEDDTCICWRGTWPHEIPTVETLVTLAQPYASVSPEVQAQLQADYEARTAPTALQQQMIELLQLLRTLP